MYFCNLQIKSIYFITNTAIFLFFSYKKPPFAFTTLISMAIENSPKGMATLGQIYEFISTRFPYFDMENKGWQNTVRHFLSVTNYFVKIPREGFKGNFWTIGTLISYLFICFFFSKK